MITVKSPKGEILNSNMKRKEPDIVPVPFIPIEELEERASPTKNVKSRQYMKNGLDLSAKISGRTQHNRMKTGLLNQKTAEMEQNYKQHSMNNEHAFKSHQTSKQSLQSGITSMEYVEENRRHSRRSSVAKSITGHDELHKSMEKTMKKVEHT